MKWTRWQRLTVASGGLTVLALGVLPAGCSGDSFSSCEGSDCIEGAGGSAGADGDATSSSTAGGASSSTAGVTAAGGLGGSGGSGGSRGSAASGGSGGESTEDGSGGSGGSGSGGGSSGGTSGGGEAGDDGLGENTTDTTDTTTTTTSTTGSTASCEDTCEGTCCDDECVDVETNVDHCGACGEKCNLFNADDACVEGACIVTGCQDPYVDCNDDPADGCETFRVGFPATPALLRPMFGAYTGSLHAREVGTLRPEFVWTPVEPVTCSAVTYEVQVDADCSYTGFAGCDFPSPEVDVTGLTAATFTPEADLPVEEATAPLGRRYYWRVRTCEWTELCSDWSEVFYVDVGRARDDVTGDGYPDVIGSAEGGGLFILRGRADFYDEGEAEIIPTAQNRLHPEGPQFSFLGDVDGDGFNDVGGAGILPGNIQANFVWLGAEAFGAMPAVVVGSGPQNHTQFNGIWAAGDFDRDGYADMMQQRKIDVDDPLSTLTLKRGGSVVGESPEDEEPIGSSDPPTPETDGQQRAAASGDFNGDGYPDLARDRNASQCGFGFQLSDGFATLADTFPGVELCAPIVAPLDFNGDHIDDLAVLSRSRPLLAVVFGHGDVDEPEEIWRVDLDEVVADLAVGDIDKSGFDDIILSDGTTFWGSADPDTEPEDLFETANVDSPIVTGDHDADGDLDVMRSSRWYYGVVTADSWGPERLTDDGEELTVVTFAH